MAGRVRGILEQLLGRRRECRRRPRWSPIPNCSGDSPRPATRPRSNCSSGDTGRWCSGLCRRAVRDEQLAEDAFQAVFIVLARKAGSIRGGNVGGWLFRVARRVAARALRDAADYCNPLPDVPADPQPSGCGTRELTEILDAEVSRLPERLRRAVILCYLGGHTTEDAARELGCPRGTVLSRLATARKRLAERLTRRGVTAPGCWACGVGDRTIGRLISQTVALAQIPFRIAGHNGAGPSCRKRGACHGDNKTRGDLWCGASSRPV